VRFLFVFLVGQGEVKILPIFSSESEWLSILLHCWLIFLQEIPVSSKREARKEPPTPKIRNSDWSKVVKRGAVYPSCATVSPVKAWMLIITWCSLFGMSYLNWQGDERSFLLAWSENCQSSPMIMPEEWVWEKLG
jgi:hypothetical protein